MLEIISPFDVIKHPRRFNRRCFNCGKYGGQWISENGRCRFLCSDCKRRDINVETRRRI